MTGTKALFATYAALVGLLILTVALSYVNLGFFNFGAALSIGILKAVLILFVFMELKKQLSVTSIMVATVVLWGILFTSLTFADYLTRGWPVNAIVQSNTPHSGGVFNAPITASRAGEP